MVTHDVEVLDFNGLYGTYWPMLKRGLIVGAALITAGAVLHSWWRNDMNASIAPSRDDLEQAYRMPDPNFAGHQEAEAVVVGIDGITVLCSTNPKGEGEHTWLIQLADDGSTRWERHYAPGQGTGRAMAALPGGGFVIAGDVQRSEMEYQARLMRVDAGGGVIATGTFGPRGATGFVAVVILSDGLTFAGGTARRKGWLLRADNDLRASWDLTIDDVDNVNGLASLADGGFAMVATQEKLTVAHGMTRLTAFAGDQRLRWQKRLPTTGRGEPAALAAFPDGGLVAVGHRAASERDTAQLWVVRVDMAGEVAWERLHGRADEERRGRAIVPLPDGGVAVAGDALRDGRRGLRVVRLVADGTVAWERPYGGGKHEYDVARGLAQTSDGGLVLVGLTTAKGPGKTNVWIMRLDGDGRLLWDRVFGSAG